MKTVEPPTGKSGDVVTVTGENLDKSNVAELYLTDGQHDIKAVMTQQTATSIKFKIPSSIKPGRLALMVLTKGKNPKLIEEPVKVTIE
jgi:siroheme synthase (precorrin-2 oxidase/ferrochelatase)